MPPDHSGRATSFKVRFPLISRYLAYSIFALVFLVPAPFSPFGGSAIAQTRERQGISKILLVHGAWADGSSWSKVIPLLEADGLNVTAVQLPLTSLADDVATVKRALASEVGPVLLVGHSYGGAVITEAGNDARVAGLVYVAAFAPDQGQSTLDQIMANPTPVGAQLVSDEFGFLKLSPTGIFEDFAPELAPQEREVLRAVQGPTAAAAFGAPIESPAWRTKPTWFVIAAHDRVISPGLEESEARIMNAKAITIPACHVVMLSHPVEVAQFVEKAALEGGAN